jgi:hypothetical protein
MAPTLKRAKYPFGEDQIVVATRTFAWSGDTVCQGQKFRGGDRIVRENWTAFRDDASTLPSELENPFAEMPPPPEHAPPVQVQSSAIPPHRQVVSTVDVMLPASWSPGSPGTETHRPPPFVKSSLRSGQICDVLSDVVREHPSWFRWAARDVTPEDVERISRQESEGVN